MGTEVQSHGFSWERELMKNVYGVTDDDTKSLTYTSKNDVLAHMNRVDKCNLSIKTTGTVNSVCMADCLRVFDSVGEDPIHLTVIYYKQNDHTNCKELRSIVEVDLTMSRELLFGALTRCQIEQLDKLVKSVPQKRKPTTDERNVMYRLKNSLQKLSGAIRLDIKCNSTQSRLQCSFNKFQKFLEENTRRIVAKSNTNEFRGGIISSSISSGRRVFKKNTV